MKVVYKVILSLLLIILIIFSLSSFSESTIQPVIQNYTIAWSDIGLPQPYTLYPLGPWYPIVSLMFDTLVWLGPNGYIPWLAQNWTQVNSTTWIFYLRHNIMWSNGEKLTAYDVVFSFNYTKYVFTHIGYLWWASYILNIKKVIELNNYTVEIVLNKPMRASLFMKNIASMIFIVPHFVWENVSNPKNYDSQNAFIGSGPFILKKYEPGVGYFFIANPNFFLGKPIVQNLNILILSQQNLLNDLISGKIDSAMLNSYRDVKTLLSVNSSFSVVSINPGLAYVLFFNNIIYPFNITEFRQAIAYSINLTAIWYKAGEGPQGSFMGNMGDIPPYSEYYNPNIINYSYNPEMSIYLLEKIGFKFINGNLYYPNGSPVIFTLYYPSEDPIASTIADIIQYDLQQIGINVQLKEIPQIERVQIQKTGEFQMMIGIYGGVLDPAVLLNMLIPGTVQYVYGFNNTEIKNLLIDYENTLNSTQALLDVYKVQYILSKEVPLISLLYPKVFWVYNKNLIDDWFFNPNIESGPPWILNKLVFLSIYQSTTLSTVTLASKAQSQLINPLMITGLVILVIAIVMVIIFLRRRIK